MKLGVAVTACAAGATACLAGSVGENVGAFDFGVTAAGLAAGVFGVAVAPSTPEVA